jgi:hypothetical protein
VKEIEIRVGADGSIEVEGHGFKGIECDKALAAIEAELGTTTSRVNKPEYRQNNSAQQHIGRK